VGVRVGVGRALPTVEDLKREGGREGGRMVRSEWSGNEGGSEEGRDGP